MLRGASGKRHAQAVFQIALEKNSLERWKSDLRVMSSVMLEPGFYSLLENPALHFSEKAGLLKPKLADINAQAMNLALLLVDKGRLRILPDIVDEYDRILDAHFGLERVMVTTALPLTDEEKGNIKKEMETRLNKKVVLTNEVRRDIIGGLVIRIGDKLIDGSISTELRTFEKELVGARR